jgi:hypothetical protein
MLRLLALSACLGFAAPVLGQEPDPAPANPSQGWTVPRSQVIDLPVSEAGRHYQAYVKLPSGYDDPDNAARRYPVVYLNDGPYTFQVAAGITHLPMNNGQFEDAILVGLSFAAGENGMASRVRDLTQAADASWTRYETGGGAAYLDYLAETVLPAIEAHYRIDPQRRILAGQSLGGSFGVYALLERPDLFSGYVLTSPSLWYLDREIFERARERLADHAYDCVRLYLAVGETEHPDGRYVSHDMVGDLEDFGRLLDVLAPAGLQHRVEIVGGGATHYTTFPVGLLHGLDWMLASAAEE